MIVVVVIVVMVLSSVHLVLLQGWSCSNLSGLQCSCCCYVAKPARDGLCLCKERTFHNSCQCQLSFYLYFHALFQCFSSFPTKLKQRHHLADIFDKGRPGPSSLRRLPAARRLRRFQQVLLPPPQDVQPQLGKLGLQRSLLTKVAFSLAPTFSSIIPS